MEDKIFQKYTPNFDKLVKFGFKKVKNGYKYEELFADNLFKAIILADFDGKITGKVFDLENDDEFLPLKTENHKGAFVAKIRTSYEKILENIRDNCFTREYFIYPQSNRITNLIIEKYGDYPEFLWEKYDGSGIFRNKKSQKWYAAILDVKADKFKPGHNETLEVLDIKLSPENITKRLENKHFYPAYHMNKKHWITVILDDSLKDEEILELIAESYDFSNKK